MMLLSKPEDDNDDMYGDLASYWYHVDIFFYFVMYSFFFFFFGDGDAKWCVRVGKTFHIVLKGMYVREVPVTHACVCILTQ